MKTKWLAVMAGLTTMRAAASPYFHQTGSTLVMSNFNVVVNYNLASGTAAFFWQNSNVISSFYSAVTNGAGVNPGYLSTGYASRSWGQSSSNTVVVTNTGNGMPTMLQFFTLDQNDSFLVSISLTATTNLQSRWMAPLVVNSTGGVNLGSYVDDRALFVPFDNDDFVSYNSESINGSDTGCEVGAFYDNTTRTGLVVGSVTHDLWKTGVSWSGGNNALNTLVVFGGLTNHWTWDSAPHGLISGATISSPKVFVGFGSDWRVTMENFADENTNFAPSQVWGAGVPFGWNSWGVTQYQNNINYAAAIAVSDSIHTNLEPYGFLNNGTAYVNLDSYWNNLWTDEYGTQVSDFVNHCHANGQKAGVYFTPFAFWGNLNDATNYEVPEGWPGTYSVNFYSILLKDANGHAIPYANGNAYAIDPTNPDAQGYIDYYTTWFRYWGFDYVKLDFLSLGALEGVHYDTGTSTGIQAYNEGMQYVLGDLGGTMFVSESIAPIFPYRYADSRRIACDAEQSKIVNTAYTMNALSCGWWLDRLYPLNDPDLMVFDNGPDTNEDQSRLINCAITGLFLNGSLLTNTSSIALAQTCLTNAAINAVARIGQTFRPVDGATGTGAANILALQNNGVWYIAVFNYTGSSATQAVNLASAGLPVGTYVATNLWDGSTTSVSGIFSVTLNEKQAKLFSLAQLVARPSITTSPGSYTNFSPMYAGVPITLSVSAAGTQPLFYQWYQIVGGVTNALAGATNSSLIHLSQSGDTNTPLEFFVVVSNTYGTATSSIATLNLSRVIAGSSDAVSVQFTITNYSGYSGGFFLAPTDTVGVYAVSNWNPFVITPGGGGGGTQPGVSMTNLMDRFGVTTPVSIEVANVSDGWHQTADTITSSDNANAWLMNTFWKTHNDSSPSTNVLYVMFTNVPAGTYSAWVYLMQNNAGATGYVYTASGPSNYFREFTTFNSSSNFVTAVDTNGTVDPYVNYLKLTGLAPSASGAIPITVVWTGGSDGIGVCGVQLVPPPVLATGPRTPGRFSFQFPAPQGQIYIVESSSDLSNWSPIATNSPTNGVFIFTTNTAAQARFYRVKQ